MSNIQKDLEFFRKRRAGAKMEKYKIPKVILVDVDGTVVRPKVKMYSMSEEKLGKKTIDELEKKRIRPLRKKMIKKEISFEKYLLELSKIDIELGEYYQDYKDFFFGLVKKNLINEPLVRALGRLKNNGAKVIFLTSNLKIYGDIISDNVLRLIGEKGKFDGSLGAEYIFDRAGKAVGVKSLISHENAVCEGIKFQTKITAIKNHFKKNKIKAKDPEVAVVSDADTVLMKHFGLGGLVLYPLKELSDQFKEIEYIQNARKGLFDFCVDYNPKKDLKIAQRKWEAVLGDPNILKYSDEKLREYLYDKK
jgi:hypothetical protein